MSNWLELSVQLVSRVCMVVAGAFACIHLRWVRRALRGLETSWPHRLTMMLIFGGLGILGTHSGILVNINHGEPSIAAWWVGLRLNENQGMDSLRDTMALVGGLIGGPWVGFGAGLLAGSERYWLGGIAPESTALATVALGIFAGLVRHFYPYQAATSKGAIIVALLGTLLNRLIMFYAIDSYTLGIALTGDIAVHQLMANVLGCVLFIWVTRDLDRDKLENEARAAELCALRAQIEPHFFKNTLGAIRTLIRLDPDQAREYVVKLADFFQSTLNNASANTIPLHEEWAQLQRYLDFQQLRFGEKLRYRFDMPPDLLDCRLPPRSLLSLAENALTHGRRGRLEGLELRFEARERDGCLILRVADDGCGIPPERLATLGKEPVESASPHGNGSGLYYLSRSLELAFGDRADLAITSKPGDGTEVVLTLPKET